MKALVYQKPGRANGGIRQVPDPACGPNQVVIKIMACGICKPAENNHDRDGSLIGGYPSTPGHEFAGVVARVGENVTQFKPGDRVTADNGVRCGKCYFCKIGQPRFCRNFKTMGHNLPGGMAEYAVAEDYNVFLIPEALRFEQACLSELIGCCLHCVDNADLRFGDVCAVLGVGSSGSIITQLLLHSNAGRVYVFDSVQSKLDRLAAKGAIPVLVERGNYDALKGVVGRDLPFGFDRIIDTTGDGALINFMVNLLKQQGMFVAYSFAQTPIKTTTLTLASFVGGDRVFRGSGLSVHEFQRALDALARGLIDTELIITHLFPLDRYFEALDLNNADENSIKVIIQPND